MYLHMCKRSDYNGYLHPCPVETVARVPAGDVVGHRPEERVWPRSRHRRERFRHLEAELQFIILALYAEKASFFSFLLSVFFSIFISQVVSADRCGIGTLENRFPSRVRDARIARCLMQGFYAYCRIRVPQRCIHSSSTSTDILKLYVSLK